MSAVLAPKVIDRFVIWRYRRRGGYTRTIVRVLKIFESLLHPDFGFIAQTPNFGRPLCEIDGFINKEDVERVQNWTEACRFARAHIRQMIEDVNAKIQQGRDPFEALLPVLDAVEPWDGERIEHAVKGFAERRGVGMGKVAQPLRVALTGLTVSPSIGDTLAIVGKASTARRINRCLELHEHV
jgi:hypothetical protein